MKCVQFRTLVVYNVYSQNFFIIHVASVLENKNTEWFLGQLIVLLNPGDE